MKKREMTPYEASLFKEMKQLVKRANQRIVRIERETGIQDAFAIQKLKDYLSSETMNAWTEKGRISQSQKFSILQMKAIIKETKNFLNKDISTVKGIKSYIKNLNTKMKKSMSYKQASTFYKASVVNYEWIYEYFGASEKTGGSYFWDFAREARDEKWDVDTFINKIKIYITDRSIDENLKNELKKLYSYALGVNG